MKGAFVTNRYYTDKGTQHAFESLCRAFGDIPLIRITPTLLCGGANGLHSNGRGIELFSNGRGAGDKTSRKKEIFCNEQDKKTTQGGKCDFDFAIYWDKDFYLAAELEKSLPVFNNAKTLEICDDKLKTYANLSGINYPKTISAPLMYDVNDDTDNDFLDFVEKELGFPLIVKENKGSQGRQVHKADNREQLSALYQKLKHTAHHYQKLVGEFGTDLRIYTVGGKAVAACKRQGIDFRSNLGAGGTVSLVSPSAEYLRQAEEISRMLNLDFGAVDFLIAESPTFLEVNSNAYFTGIERLGISIAAPIADYVLSRLCAKNLGENSGETTAGLVAKAQRSGRC